MTTVLVVGARPSSLGAIVAEQARYQQWDVITIGLGDEDYRMDLLTADLDGFVANHRPDHVVCTAGVNRSQEGRDLRTWWGDHLFANVVGPMRLLDAYAKVGPPSDTNVGHFVAISSNSAQIPRTGSGPYCASKAALSMALRVGAREAASSGMDYVVYGYEPGLLNGTPMTEETKVRFSGPLTRMRGPGLQNGMSVHSLAAQIIHGIGFGGSELNGCLLRIDAGEV